MPEEPSLDERIARQLVEDDDRISREIARGYGRPPNAAKASDARELELWLETDPTFDEYAAWAEHASRGTDPWVAKTEIALKKYPNRLALMQAGRPKVKDQIDFANRLGERAEREQARRQAEALAQAPSAMAQPVAQPSAMPALSVPSMPQPVGPPLAAPAPPQAAPEAVPQAVPQAVPGLSGSPPAPEPPSPPPEPGPMALPGVSRSYETEPPY